LRVRTRGRSAARIELALLALAVASARLFAQGPAPGAGAVVEAGSLTSFELAALDKDRALLVLVVAPIEEHGPHLPLSTDLVISSYLARDSAERFLRSRPDWTVIALEPLSFSPSAAAEGFAGNSSTSGQAVADSLVATLRGYALAGFRYCLVVDNHLQPDAQAAIGRSVAYARRAWGIRAIQPEAAIIYDEGFRRDLAARVEDPSVLGADIHAGYIETSAMLAIDPGSVRTGLLPGLESFPMGAAEFGMAAARGKSMREMGATRGYVGAPSKADAEFGRAFLELMAERIHGYLLRLADPNDQAVFKDARTFFASIPMQGPTFVFAYPVASGSAADGFTPGGLFFGQSADRVAASLFAGWGIASAKPILKGHLALSQFFLNRLELLANAGNAGGINSLESGLALYAGHVQPGFLNRPPLRFLASYRLQEAIASDRDALLASSGRIDSLYAQAEYFTGLKEPLAFSETGLASREPVYARLGYEYGPSFLGGERDWDLLWADIRWYLPVAKDLNLTGKSEAFWGGLAWSDENLPGQKLLYGPSASAFRGYSSLSGNLFSRAIIQSLDLRAKLRLPPNPALAALGGSVFADAGFGSEPGGELLSRGSFRLDAGAAITAAPRFAPMEFRLQFGLPLIAPGLGSEWRVDFGIGASY
jgi:creatinine amidohydrolase